MRFSDQLLFMHTSISAFALNVAELLFLVGQQNTSVNASEFSQCLKYVTGQLLPDVVIVSQVC